MSSTMLRRGQWPNTDTLTDEPSDGVGTVWSLAEGPATGQKVTLRFYGHVTAGAASAAVKAVAACLQKRARPTVIVADLGGVVGFDAIAPLAAVHAALGTISFIERVDILVRHRVARVAAVSAACVLGLPFTVESV
jgi:hypothetical protein